MAMDTSVDEKGFVTRWELLQPAGQKSVLTVHGQWGRRRGVIYHGDPFKCPEPMLKAANLKLTPPPGPHDVSVGC